MITIGYPRTRWTYANDVWRMYCNNRDADEAGLGGILDAIVESSLRHAAERIRIQSINNSIVRAP